MKRAKGLYSWSIFKRHCKTKESFNKKIEILNNIIGKDSTKLTFEELIYELSKYWVENDFNEYKEEFSTPWFNVLLTNKDNKNSTTYPQSRTPFFVNNGEAYITYLNGENICPIENEKIINKIINNGTGIATLLENGMIYINSIENYEPINNFKEKFMNFFNVTTLISF